MLEIALSAAVAALVAGVVAVILSNRHHRATLHAVTAHIVLHEQAMREAIQAAKPGPRAIVRTDPEVPHTHTRISRGAA